MTERMSDIFETQLRTYRKLYTVDSRSLVHSSSLLFRIVNGLSTNTTVSTHQQKWRRWYTGGIAKRKEAINSDLLFEGVTF